MVKEIKTYTHGVRDFHRTPEVQDHRQLWSYNFFRANVCECNGSSEIPFVDKIELNNENLSEHGIRICGSDIANQDKDQDQDQT